MSLSSFLQENLLTLLVFDDQRYKVVRGTVEADLFTGFYREIAVRAYEYIDRHKKPPKTHIADLFEKELKSKNKREKNIYTDLLTALNDAKEHVNPEYVLTQLGTFIKRQSLRTVAVDLMKALQKDSEESLEEADRLIKSANSNALRVFDPGTRLSDIPRALKFLDNPSESFPTGIPEFDRLGFGPTRKELTIYMADTKKGKTWWAVHLAKIAILNQLRVVHVTLEMNEEKISQRYIQALFALAKRKDEVTITKFDKSDYFNIETKTIKPKLTLEDPKIRSKLKKRMLKWKKRILEDVYIKEFPMGRLSLGELEAYLDNLEVTEKFVPDLLVVDYPDLMTLPNNRDGYRHGVAHNYRGLRGIAGARNIAVAAPTQANRAGSGKKFLGRTNISEAYNKIQDADTTLAYSQTDEEKALGLARVSVIAGRNDIDQITVVLSQNYTMGQYVVDSVLMPKNYFDIVSPEKPSSDSDDDDFFDDDD